MFEVTLEESITAIYSCIFNKKNWEACFNLNTLESQRFRRKYLRPKILELAIQGYDYRQLADKFGVPKATVYQWVKKEAGIDAGKRKGTKAEN